MEFKKPEEVIVPFVSWKSSTREGGGGREGRVGFMSLISKTEGRKLYNASGKMVTR